jgi:hypothetical protein
MTRTKCKGKGLPLRRWYARCAVIDRQAAIVAWSFFCAPAHRQTKPEGWVFFVGLN